MATTRGAIIPSQTKGTALVEYVGPVGTRTYIGKVSRKPYRFGSDPEHKVKRVMQDDVPYLLSSRELKAFEAPEKPVAAKEPEKVEEVKKEEEEPAKRPVGRPAGSGRTVDPEPLRQKTDD